MNVRRSHQFCPSLPGGYGITAVMIASLCSAVAAFGGSFVSPVTIAIEDTSAFHVHQPGSKFELGVRISAPKQAAMQYQWRDSRGKALTAFMPVIAGHSTLTAPHADPGYYGLVFRAAPEVRLPDREPGEEREYGFVISPVRSAPGPATSESHFGLVHATLDDPCVPSWVKTATWQTYGTATWAAEMRRRRADGATELPLILDAEWEQDDTRAIAASEIKALAKRLRAYFEADTSVHFWELGLEENLGSRYRQSYYWPNLAAKAEAARRSAPAGTGFIYQIAELDLSPVRRFLASNAAESFDILALHPYAWPDFPAPERWLGNYLQSVRNIMRESGAIKPIWFTEVGVPHHGNAPGQFFGYPESRRAVKGLTRAEVARYLIRLHVLALHDGVEKVFWYNYRDQRADRDQAEQHFGLRDYWGYPKPAYAAWCQMQTLLERRRPTLARETHDGMWIRAFDSSNERVWVLWSYPGKYNRVALHALDKSLTPSDVVAYLDSSGKPLKLEGKLIAAGPDPIYLITRLSEKK